MRLGLLAAGRGAAGGGAPGYMAAGRCWLGGWGWGLLLLLGAGGGCDWRGGREAGGEAGGVEPEVAARTAK
jgi:hypothetical protein